ncbi:MAG: DUF4065 domain-containing protein [bacterium]|nr:DUF4065 domain-containing protein [bacterium]
MSKKTGEFVRMLRTEKGLAQLEVAKEIGVSRSSYIAIEQGVRELQLSEAEQLGRMFGVSTEELSNGKRAEKNVVLESKKGVPADEVSGGTRISVPAEQVKKFKEVFLYILQKVGGKPNIGQTALYKLLYFIDFDYYEKYEKQLIGAKYMRNTHGPTPVAFKKILTELEKGGKVEEIKSKFYKYEQTKYLINPSVTPDLSVLNAQELSHIDWELERLSGLTAKQLSDLSHLDTPWKVAKEKDVLNYNHVFYRPEETSVREYEPL